MKELKREIEKRKEGGGGERGEGRERGGGRKQDRMVKRE